MMAWPTIVASENVQPQRRDILASDPCAGAWCIVPGNIVASEVVEFLVVIVVAVLLAVAILVKRHYSAKKKQERENAAREVEGVSHVQGQASVV